MENQEARDQGQGAALDSPRCLTELAVKTKSGGAQKQRNPKGVKDV